MAQTKRKRTRKHRGTPAGTIDRSGRTGRPQTRDQSKKTVSERRAERLDKPPSWKGAINRAAIAAVVFGVLVVVLFEREIVQGVVLAAVMFLLYIPLGYATDTAIYRFRQRKRSRRLNNGCPCVHRRPGGREHLHLSRRTIRARPDRRPGERRQVAAAIDELGVTLDGILLTQRPFRPRQGGRPGRKRPAPRSAVPEIEKVVLGDIMAFVPWPGFRPFESYDAEHTLSRELELAGFDIDVLHSRPPPRPHDLLHPRQAHLLRRRASSRDRRPHRPSPSSDSGTLLESIRGLVEGLPRPPVYPGHIGIASLGAERAGNRSSATDARLARSPSSRPLSTLDVQPDARQRLALYDAGELLRRAGYDPVDAVFEDAGCSAAVGEYDDIVQKEMFTFEDKAAARSRWPQGHRRPLPRLHRARHPRLAQPVDHLDLSPSSPTRPPRPAAFAG